MGEKEPVSLFWQTVLCILPYIWIFAFLRIEKFMMGLVLLAVGFAVSIGINMVLPYPWGLFGSIIFTIVLPIYYVRKWSREWNYKIAENS